MENDEINLPPMIVHRMEGNATRLFLEQRIETIHRVDTIWWIEQIKLRIEPGSVASVPAWLQTPSPSFPSMDYLNMLIWNCRGVENNTFKRNMKELFNTHKPAILILMETKVTYSSMGNFFNNLGISACTIIDLVRRSKGIWLIWNTNHGNVRASAVFNQYIQAIVHKEDYEEWVLSPIYVSHNPSARETLWGDLEDTANSINKPWLVTADFNDYTNQGERRSFSPTQNHGRS
ncbi:hypothetical protein ACSBR1_034722 [Camellia fascicularis]